MRFIAVDLGSSNLKAAVVEADRADPLAVRKVPTPSRLPNPNPHIHETDAAELARAVQGIIDSFAAEFSGLRGVFLSTQMHGCVYVCPGRRDVYVSWQDLRCMDPAPDGAVWMDHITAAIPAELAVPSGMELRPSLAVCSLWARLHADPALPRDGMLCTLGSYIIRALTGRNVCHITNGGALGVADIDRRVWNHALLERAGMGAIHLPDLTSDDFHPCGTYTTNGQTLTVYPDWGDQQLSVFGCDTQPGDAVVNIATGAQVIVFADGFVPGPYEVRPWFGQSYFRTIVGLPSGRNLNVVAAFVAQAVRDVTGAEPDMDAVWSGLGAQTAPDASGLQLDTFGMYPGPGRTDGGTLRGIRYDNFTPRALFAAAWADMARVFAQSLHEICDAGGVPPVRRLVCAGGVSWQQPHLVAAISRAAGLPCVLSPSRDEALHGFARAARTLAERGGV